MKYSRIVREKEEEIGEFACQLPTYIAQYIRQNKYVVSMEHVALRCVHNMKQVLACACTVFRRISTQARNVKMLESHTKLFVYRVYLFRGES